MEKHIWEEEQQHLNGVVEKLKGHIEVLQLFMKKQKGELIEERQSVSKEFSDLSGEKGMDFVTILPTLKEKEQRYIHVNDVLSKLELLYKSAYFGRIDIEEEQLESLYIGLATFGEEKKGNIIIHDWRAPISSLFYENKLGEAFYQIPSGEMVPIQIHKRRQFKISYDKLLQILDADLYIGDEVLQSLLTDTAKQKMKSIVTTIQSDQNAVIRSESHRNMMVLGPPGSGKTSVAMQRIAYLLYQYRRTLSAKNIMLISPSDLFNDYISNVLPELGEENVLHSTYYRLYKGMKHLPLATETFYENVERLQNADLLQGQSFYWKNSNTYATHLIHYLQGLEIVGLPFYTLSIGKKVFISATELQELFYRKYTNLEIDFRLKKIRNHLMPRLREWKEQAILRRYEELRGVDQYIGDDEDLMRQSKKEIEKQYSPLHSAIEELGFVNIMKIYTGSIRSMDTTEAKEVYELTLQQIKSKQLFYEDLGPLMYIQARIKGIDRNLDIKHIVIDEIQDYSFLQFKAIQQLFPKAHFTLLGDKNQVVHPTEKDQVPRELSDITIVNLNKSYRSTHEITDFMSAIIKQENVRSLGVRGRKPLVKKVDKEKQLADIKTTVDSYYETNTSFVILCKDMASCRMLFKKLKNIIPSIQLISQEQKVYMKGILIMPGYMAKGFEFTTVLIADADQSIYAGSYDKFLLYTMASRATRNLIIFYYTELAESLKLIPKDLYHTEILK
ncbi:MAG: RNA polymerase recycling motor HelD [Psychrobacillus sp.]